MFYLETIVLESTVRSLVAFTVQEGQGKGTLTYTHAAMPAYVYYSYHRFTMSAHFHVSYGIKVSFSGNISQEKTAGKCGKDGTRHLAHLDQPSVPVSHFASRPTLRIESDYIFSPLQKLICQCQFHNSHLLGCLSTAPAAQTAKSRGCKILALPEYNGNAKS